MNDKFKGILEKVKNLHPIWEKYGKYVICVGLFAMIVVTMLYFTGEDYIAKRLAAMNSRPVSGEDYVPDKEFEINGIVEVNELINTYFEAYIEGDFETLEMIASPMSEMEESYIDVMNQYYEEFRNITCYTKHGLSKDSYIVVAKYDIKFIDIEQTAPTLVLFYVQTDEDGGLYINNLYSDFNRRYKEKAVNKDVNTAFIKFTTQDDYIALHYEVDNAFKELIMENEEIYVLTKRTIPLLRQEWEDTVFYAHEDDSETESETETEFDSGWFDGVTEDPTGTEGLTTQEPSSQIPESQEPVAQEPESQEPESQEPVIERVKVQKNDVNVRSKAGTDGKKLGQVDKGNVFEVKERVTGSDGKIWVKIDYNGKEGYIRSDYLEDVAE